MQPLALFFERCDQPWQRDVERVAFVDEGHTALAQAATGRRVAKKSPKPLPPVPRHRRNEHRTFWHELACIWVTQRRTPEFGMCSYSPAWDYRWPGWWQSSRRPRASFGLGIGTVQRKGSERDSPVPRIAGWPVDERNRGWRPRFPLIFRALAELTKRELYGSFRMHQTRKFDFCRGRRLWCRRTCRQVEQAAAN